MINSFFIEDTIAINWFNFSKWINRCRSVNHCAADASTQGSRSTGLRELVNALLYMTYSCSAWRLFHYFPQYRNIFFGGEMQASSALNNMLDHANWPESGGSGDDKIGLMVALMVHSLGFQRCGSLQNVMKTKLKWWPWLRYLFAVGRYAGPELKGRLEEMEKFAQEIVKCCGHAEGFKPLRGSWVIERAFICTDHASEWERTVRNHWISWGMVPIANNRLLLRRIARAWYRSLQNDSDC